MTRRFRPALALAALLAATLVAGGAAAEEAFPAETLVHCGRLLDVHTGELLAERTVAVTAGRITAVETGYRQADDGATVHDLRNATCLPGLMDMHTHLSHESSPTSYVDRYRWNPGDYAFRMVPYAERTLRAGFTTVRDLGGPHGLAIDLREAIAAGVVPGPRIYTAGKSIATTGGHGDPSNGLRDDLLVPPTPEEGVVDGADEARQAVRARYKEGADLIKITATGGVLSVAKSGLNPQFTDDEVAAIVATAKDYGFTVAAHAHGVEGMQRAIRAGVDSIEHGTLMDEATMRLMVEQGTYFVPTISAGRFVADKAEVPGYYPDVVRPKAAALGPQIQDTAGRAYRAGVKIAFGTDSGVSPHGDNAQEFVYMVEAGIPALAALRSATLVAAELVGAEADLGALEAGKIADLVAVDGDPLSDISVMLAPVFVMKDGAVYRDETR